MMDALKPALAKLAQGEALSRAESFATFEAILSGKATQAQIGALLMGLHVRGEQPEEITGAVEALRTHRLPVTAPQGAVDIVGTGGDGAKSYNVSTLAALIVAACGVPVAKHGNRAASSQSGASDVLTALGVNIDLEPAEVERCLQQVGIGFMMAPRHHAAMRHVSLARTELGIRTIFNLLGPLANPAGVKRQLIGVFSPTWLEPLAEVLRTLGSERVWLCHGHDGLDEITTTTETEIVELNAGSIRHFRIRPEEAGLARADPAALRGGDAAHNAQALRAVVAGARNAYRDISVLNAAAALVIADRVKTLIDGVALAARALDEGRVQQTLDRLIAISHAKGPL